MVWTVAKKLHNHILKMHVVSVLVSLLPPVIVFRLVFWAFSNVSAELMVLLLVYVAI